MNAAAMRSRSASAGKSATAASPAPAAGSRMGSCSAISRSCRRLTPSTSCSTASATSAPARCSKSPTRAIRSRGARARRRPAHRLRALRDLSRRRSGTTTSPTSRALARRPRRLPDRLGHHLRRCARARRRAHRQGPLGAAHHHADRAGRSVPRRHDRHHALAHAAAGDPRDAGLGRFPLNHGAPIHLGDPARDRRRSRQRRCSAARWRRCRRAGAGVLGVRRHAAERGRKRGRRLLLAHAPAHGFITDLRPRR